MSLFERAYYGVWYKTRMQSRIDLDFPKQIQVEPTSACNLTCYFCPRDQSRKKSGLMDFAVFRKIVDEAASHGGRHYALFKDGESFIHPRFLEMLAYIDEKDPTNTMNVTTNGQLLTEKNANGLIDARVASVTVSIGATTQETYEKVRGKQPLAKVEENVRALVALKARRKSRRPDINVQIIATPEAAGEVEAFKVRWTGQGVNVQTWDMMNWAGAVKTPPKTLPARYPCNYLWTFPSINWDGDVSVCCVDWDSRGVIGNVARQSLAEIWRSETLRKIREAQMAGRHEGICKDCDVWAKTPDILFPWQKRAPAPR